jgi:hypothetical protein
MSDPKIKELRNKMYSWYDSLKRLV